MARFRKRFRPRFRFKRGGGSFRRSRGFRVPILGIRIPMLVMVAAAAIMFVPALKSKFMTLINKK